MSRPYYWLVLSTLLLIMMMAPNRRAIACSICLAGDPVFSAEGTTAQQVGSFSAFLEVRGFKKRSGVLPGHHEEEEEPEEEEHGKEEERSDDQRLDLYLTWTPIERLTVTIDLPWAFNEITEIEDGERETSKLSGFSDMSLQTSLVLWRNRDVLPSSWLEARAFLKFPTGKSKQKVNGARDPHLQLGTGSWDFGFGLAGVHRLDWASLYSSVSYRENTEGSLDYEYGDVFLANAAVEVPLGHALGQGVLDPFSLGFELNFRYSDSDVFRGDRYRHSGGSVLYLTPSLRVKIPWPWESGTPSARAAVQIPATSSWLNGFQHEDPIWFVGLHYAY